ncbi:high mobility group B2 [Euphorbia peplus]|nr:high mobility group B2 [Euphorbia peplus]
MKVGKSKANTKSSKLSVMKKPFEPVKKINPNNLKKPYSAFFVFLEEFRQTFKKEYPKIRSVGVVGKAAGDKWKALSEAEKAPFVAMAKERKLEYEKKMRAESELNDDEDDEEDNEDEDDDE